MAERSLDNIRSRIDEIDTTLHKLIIERASLGRPLAEAKAQAGEAGALMRPGREAQVMRGLLERHDGPLPALVVYRIWRELVTANLQLQGVFGVHVFGAEQDMEFWELARAQFGAASPLTLHHSSGRLMKALEESDTDIGVVPVPGASDGADTWWADLLTDPNCKQRIVARLPFVIEGVRRAPVSAYILASREPEASGDDTSIIGMTTEPDVTAAWIASRVGSLGLQMKLIGMHTDRRDPPRRLFLFETSGYRTDAQDVVDGLGRDANAGILSAELVGAFANPIMLP
jgi:chorismate mutase